MVTSSCSECWLGLIRSLENSCFGRGIQGQPHCKARAWDTIESSPLWNPNPAKVQVLGDIRSIFLKWQGTSPYLIKRAGHFQWEKSMFLTWDIYSFLSRNIFKKTWPGKLDSSPEAINYSRKKHMEEHCTGQIRKTHIWFQTYFFIVTNVTTKKNKSNILLTYQICISAMIFNP